MRQCVKDALAIPELNHTLLNVIGVDDNKEPEDYSDAELVKEAQYILSCFHEGGHSLNDDLTGEYGDKEAQRSARKQVKQLKRFIEKYDRPEALAGNSTESRTSVEDSAFALTKRQREVLAEYGTEEPTKIFGVDYNVAMNLVMAGLLEYDHISDTVRRGTGAINPCYRYRLMITHPALPITQESVVVSDPRLAGREGNKLVREFANGHGVFLKDLYVELIPVLPDGSIPTLDQHRIFNSPYKGSVSENKAFAQEHIATRPGRYYGVIQTGRENEAHLKSLGVEVADYDDDTRGGFVVSMTEAAKAEMEKFPADYKAQIVFRADDAGQAPVSEMTAEQLLAEIAFCDYMVASSIPYSPNTTTRDDWHAGHAGFGSGPTVPSAVTFMEVRSEARRCLVSLSEKKQQGGTGPSLGDPTP